MIEGFRGLGAVGKLHHMKGWCAEDLLSRSLSTRLIAPYRSSFACGSGWEPDVTEGGEPWELTGVAFVSGKNGRGNKISIVLVIHLLDLSVQSISHYSFA